MTEAEMRYRLQHGEDMAYYKLMADGRTIVRKTAEETDRFYLNKRFERLERPPDEQI